MSKYQIAHFKCVWFITGQFYLNKTFKKIIKRPPLLIMQIKNTMRYKLTPIHHVMMAIIKKMITSVGEDIEKWEPLYTVGGNVNWYSHY